MISIYRGKRERARKIHNKMKITYQEERRKREIEKMGYFFPFLDVSRVPHDLQSTSRKMKRKKKVDCYSMGKEKKRKSNVVGKQKKAKKRKKEKGQKVGLLC